MDATDDKAGRVPELAVVILAVGAPVELRGALASLRRQEPRPEIVVVNSGGGDLTDIRAAAGPDVRFIESEQRLWPGAARNVGIRETRAPYIAFMASDHILTDGWCAARLARHRAGTETVACAVINSHPRNVVAWASHLGVLLRRLPGIPPEEARRYGVSYSRQLLERVGPFREDLRIGEDTELNGRLKGADQPAWAPEVQTIHLNPTKFTEMVKDQYKRGWRSGFHWPLEDRKGALLTPSLKRFWTAVRLSSISVSGIERLYVIASWPLLLVGIFGHGMGFRAGYRQRLADKSAGAVPADVTEGPLPAAEPER